MKPSLGLEMQKIAGVAHLLHVPAEISKKKANPIGMWAVSRLINKLDTSWPKVGVASTEVCGCSACDGVMEPTSRNFESASDNGNRITCTVDRVHVIHSPSQGCGAGYLLTACYGVEFWHFHMFLDWTVANVVKWLLIIGFFGSIPVSLWNISDHYRKNAPRLVESCPIVSSV